MDERIGISDDFNGFTAWLDGRVVDNGVGRSLQACRDKDGGVWLTTQRYHAAPVYYRSPLSWQLMVVLMIANRLNTDANGLWREEYSTSHIYRYVRGVWEQEIPLANGELTEPIRRHVDFLAFLAEQEPS